MKNQGWFNIALTMVLLWQIAVSWYDHELDKVCPLGQTMQVREVLSFDSIQLYRSWYDTVDVYDGGFIESLTFNEKTLEEKGKYWIINLKLVKNPVPRSRPLLCVYPTLPDP